MKVEFDEERAHQVFTTLEKEWQKRATRGIFYGANLPQDHYPLPQDEREAAHWFFYTALTMRGGVVSDEPFVWLFKMRERYPDLFDPNVAADLKAKKIAAAMRASMQQANIPPQLALPIWEESQNGGVRKIGYKVDEFAESWKHNSRSLVNHWEGSILNVFDGVSGFEEAFARIDYQKEDEGNFTGMRRKIFSLFTIWLQEKKLIPIFTTCLPVDFHAMRVLVATGVVQTDPKPFKVNPERHPAHFEGRRFIRVSEKFMDTIALWSMHFMEKHGFSHMAINPALWFLSRDLCSREFPTRASGRREKIELIYPEVLEKTPHLWPQGYRDPANFCPLSSFCTRAIPHAPYYSYGLLALLRRIEYPHGKRQLSLEGVSGGEHVGLPFRKRR